ncbi:hypothetical protein FSP39_003469 [Pinctada imbricata]|uniref:Uncharacterized protein n=1 Tax=Pinctada imbricata TaxID=66713 RepID=A0AA88XNT1_PINIB|nr:hypothetical protein FSP39_003469 [Pinctada imbricata]
MTAFCIVLSELCERLTYYSVMENMILFSTTTLQMTSYEATSARLTYIGLFLLPVSAADYTQWFDSEDGESYDLKVFESLKVKVFNLLNKIVFGTIVKSSSFCFVLHIRFYWFINAGAFVAYLGVAYIQQNISFEIGFLIPLISMIVALIIFVAVKRQYVMTRPGGVQDDPLGVCCATECQSFDHARERNGGKYDDEMVDGVIAVLRVLPVFVLFIFYWAIYSQMQTTFFLQSERLNVQLGDVKMPAAALNVFNTIIILILIPIVDRIILPLMAKFGRSPTHLQRIGFGFILASLSVFVAGIVEIYRKQELSTSGGMTQELAGDKFNASTMSYVRLEFAYSQAPEFLHGRCMGLFLVASGLGNYVSDAILRIVTLATGSEPPNSWFPDDINKGKTEYLFFLLGGLMVLDFIVFVFVARSYKYRKQTTEQEKSPIEAKEVVTANDMPPPYETVNPAFSPDALVTKL